jgi:hypothetical protein
VCGGAAVVILEVMQKAIFGTIIGTPDSVGRVGIKEFLGAVSTSPIKLSRNVLSH